MHWYFNKKAAFKLFSAFILVAVIMGGVSYYALASMGKINSNVGMLYNRALTPMVNMSDARYELQDLRIIWRDIALSKSKSEQSELLAEAEALKGEIEGNISAYSENLLREEQQKALNNYQSDWAEYTRLFDQNVQAVMADNGDFSRMDADLSVLHEQLIGYINDIVGVDLSLSAKDYENSEKLYSTTTNILIIASILTLAICLGLGWFMTWVVAEPLKSLAALVQKVADGDLTEKTPIHGDDEIGMLGNSINRMIENIKATVQNILGAADNLSASASQVSASTEEIASASTEQANAAQTMNELFTELSEAISSVANNTEQAAELSDETVRIAQDGEKVVMSSVEGAGLVSEQMAKLEKDSNRIGEIISVIDDIADQTNLLALNAAIEAARAGDQGRGFAVVADEVRKLAERSGDATKQITEIIEGMQRNTVQSVQAVENGMEFTKKSGEAFEEIIRMVNDTSNKVTEIAGASEEQAAQSVEVLTFIESISAATEEAAASSEETASTANALADLSEELNASVAAFKLN